MRKISRLWRLLSPHACPLDRNGGAASVTFGTQVVSLFTHTRMRFCVVRVGALLRLRDRDGDLRQAELL